MSRSSAPYLSVVLVASLLAIVPMLFDGYIISFSISALTFCLLATSWGLFAGPTRYICLASAVFFGAGAYTVAVIGERLPWPAVILVAAAVGSAISFVVGMATLRLTGIYFAIFTFGLGEMVHQLTTWYEVNITHSVGRYVFLDITQRQIFWQLLGLLALVLLFAIALSRSRLGFALRVIGGDEAVARHFGLNPTYAKLGLFVASSAVMSITGAIVAPRWTYIDPAIAFNSMISFQVVIMTFLGGMQRLIGPLVGALVMSVVSEILAAYFPHAHTLLLGLMFVGVVYFLPKGLVGEAMGGLSRLVGGPSRSSVVAKQAAHE